MPTGRLNRGWIVYRSGRLGGRFRTHRTVDSYSVYELVGMRDPELPLDGCHVRLYRLRRDVQTRRHLSDAQAKTEQLKDLQLTIREAGGASPTSLLPHEF